MNIEIERKFLVDNPPGLENFSSKEILQGYLLITDEKEIRLRKKGDRYFQGVKVGRGLSREEIESEISIFQFEDLWPETEGKRIVKRRYDIYYDGIKIELDVFSGTHQGLITAEVEFKTEEESRLFEPPHWFGPEVTHDDRYKNKNLAVLGTPG